MAQATFSIRMDESLKKQFDSLCSDFGMTASTAINVFARAVVRERKIPFEISSPKQEITKESALKAFSALREQAQKIFRKDYHLTKLIKKLRTREIKWRKSHELFSCD